MHWFPVYAAALLLALPAMSAQTTTVTEVPLVEDAKGDVTVTPLGAPPQSGSGFDAVDLTALWLREDPDQLHVKVALAAMDGQPGPSQASVQAFFVFDGIEYRTGLYRSSDNEAWFGTLSSRAVGDPFFRTVGPLQVRYDTAAAQVWTSLDRDALLGESGRVMGRGDTLTGIYAKAYATLGYIATFNDPTVPVKGALLDVGDRVPDADGSTLDILVGGAQAAGPLSLTASQPFRASNGAETTYVYDIEASNKGTQARELRLEAQHLPDGWTVRLPGTSVQMPAGATIAFQVVLATPFFHEHGTSRSFHLRLADPADEAAWAQVELGVHYLAVPQPAGHHDTLFLHTHPWSATANLVNAPLGGTDGVLTFNTLAEDPDDSGQPLLAYSTAPGNNEYYGWAGCLDPGLAMGLDFDLERKGNLRVPVSSEKPILGARLYGRVLLVPEGEGMQYCFPSEYRNLDVVELATFESDPVGQIGPNGNHLFEAAIAPLVDRVAFTPGASLVLEMTVSGGGISTAGTAGLKLAPGGSLQLPLQEYSDAVAVFASSEGATEGSVFSDADPTPAKDAPATPVALLLAALAAVVLARRRLA